MRTRGIFSLARASLLDLFDQSTAFGRLALVHVAMMAGDTLVTISLAGSLFFSVSPDEAKSKVLAYLVLTIAPFAVVSPLLGPLIDKSSNGRRALVALSAGLRVLLCWQMSTHLTSLWLFPEAFVVLVCSKLYVVTRGTLVPEMARADELRQHGSTQPSAGWSLDSEREGGGFAGFNAQLTLLGTVVGLVAGSLGAGLLKSVGAQAVLISAAVAFFVATITSFRLRRPSRQSRTISIRRTQYEKDVALLNPVGDAEVVWALGAASLLRFSVGFATFLLAFGLRREHAGLTWFAAALACSGLGSLVGLSFVTRMREKISEPALLSLALALTGAGAFVASSVATLGTQVAFAAWLGLSSSIAQPSFDAITQRHVAPGSQGRTFARFAVRQQFAWVLGALLPVAFSLSFVVGDRIVVAAMTLGTVGYLVGRKVAIR
jgi:hypothetical protein